MRIPVTNLRGENDCILVLDISPSSGHVISRRSAKVARTTLKSLSERGILDWHGTSPTDPSQYYDLHRA